MYRTKRISRPAVCILAGTPAGAWPLCDYALQPDRTNQFCPDGEIVSDGVALSCRVWRFTATGTSECVCCKLNHIEDQASAKATMPAPETLSSRRTPPLSGLARIKPAC